MLNLLWRKLKSCYVSGTVCRDRPHSGRERDGTKLSASGFKSAWARAMAKAIAAGSLTETFAENDLRSKVATEARDLGQNATAMLGHSSDAVTKRHYERGTRKVEPLRKKY